MEGDSVVYVLGESTSDCGYCGPRKSGKGEKQSCSGVNAPLETSVSYGMHSEVMSVQAYQALLDRGWRRSGKWLYKPVLSKTCCQLQTIRLEVDKFEISASQRRVLKRWEKYLQGGGPGQRAQGDGVDDVHANEGTPCECPSEPSVDRNVAGSDHAPSEGTDRLSVDMVDVIEALDPVDALGDVEDGQEDEESGKNEPNDEPNDEDEVEPKRPRSPQGGDGEALLPEGVISLSEATSNALAQPDRVGLEPLATEYKWKRQRSQLCLGLLAENGQSEMSPSAGFKEKLRVDSVSFGPEDKDAVKSVVTRALDNAVASAKKSGEIPDLRYADVLLKDATKGLKKAHGSDLLFSSSIAFSIAGKSKVENKERNAEDGASKVLTPDVVATCLLKHVALDAKWLVSLRQINGHINVFCAMADKMKSASNSKKTGDSKTAKSIRSAKNAKKSSVTTLGEEKVFRVVTVPSSHPDIPQVEYELFKKYQTVHHNDKDVSLKSFKRFLCDSPLVPVSREECPSAPACGYGSFHQQYWVGDHLVAVGVVDVLPKCLSSKYFFWDPSMARFSLGTLASLLEIEWVKSQAEDSPEFRYYYLGYYLHDCHRMRYKASFAPSELLSPLTFDWVPIASIADDLDRGLAPWNMKATGSDGNRKPHTCPQNEGDGVDKVEEIDDVNLAITFPNSQRKAWKVMPFGVVRRLGLIRSGAEELSESIKHWKDMVGPVCCSNMLYAV